MKDKRRKEGEREAEDDSGKVGAFLVRTEKMDK